MYANKPIIGIAGGIGSGKSFIAKLFGEFGALVISSDDQVTDAYRDPQVRAALRSWWGDDVIRADGEINRRLIGGKIFADRAERRRLEELLHPRVTAARERAMAAAVAENPGGVVAFVWDTPLLFEVGLNTGCDAVVFVDAPQDLRLSRVRRSRGWDAAELAGRENLQWPLDRKRHLSDDVVTNTADVGEGSASPTGADPLRNQVRQVLSRILARTSQGQGLK